MTALRPSSRQTRGSCTRGRTAIAFVVVALSTAMARDAHATPSAKLVYVRGTDTAACPDETMLRRAVATRIGYDPFFPTASKTVIAQLSRAKTGYRGKIQIVGDDGVIRGERELATRGDDCSELISAMALAVSIALDDLDDGPHAAAAPEAVAPATSESFPDVAPPIEAPAPPSAADAPPTPPPAAATTTTKRLAVAVSIGPVLSLGAAPSPSVGGAVAASVRYGWAAARFDLRADLPAGGDLAGGGRVTASSVLASAALCVRGDVPFVCAGGGVGTFAASTASIPRPASDNALLGELLATAGVDVSVSRSLFVEPFVAAGLVLTRHRVFVDGIEAYRLPAVGATGGIHLGWRFL
ncbi:MAG: hypothetical protein JWO86_3811 [Myxococcaceae bacterium]|nr:hypothetical protein [Myxococcaceae bacterium]